jgi:hypothetical protein
MANGNPAIQNVLRDVSGTGGARRSVQQQFKKAGDVSKQKAQTERQQRQFQLSEKQRQLQRTAEEFQQDVQIAQNAATEDLRNFESDVRQQWTRFADALQRARDRAADNLEKFAGDETSQAAISGLFGGLNSIISGSLALGSGQDTGGLIGRAIQKNRTIRDLEQQLINQAPSSQMATLVQNPSLQGRLQDIRTQIRSEGAPERLTAIRNTPPAAGTIERAPLARSQLIGSGNLAFRNIVLNTLGLGG